MQNLAAMCWMIVHKGIVVRSGQISVRICSSLTSCLAGKPAARRLRKVWPEHGFALCGVGLLGLLCGVGTAWGQLRGLTWADRRIPMEAPYAQCITGNNDITLIASTAGGIPSFAWTEDGMVWRQSYVPASLEGSYEFIAGAATIGENWVAVGAGGVLLTSADNARTWTRQARVKNGAVNFSGVMAAGSFFVAYGKESRPGPEEGFVEEAGIFISEDRGLTWETVEIPEPSALLTAASWGDVWIVAGENGLVCVSTDAGETWETTHLESDGSFTSLAAGNGVFILVGPQGLVLRSADLGQTWQTVYAGGGDWIQGVAFGNGRFVLSGGTRAQAGSSSVDGVQWVPAVGTGAWGTIGYGPSGFLTVGGTYGRQTTVTPAPQLSRAPAVFRGQVGRDFRTTLRSSTRNAGFQAMGIPEGLTLTTRSGVLSGQPLRPGLFPAFLYATVQGSGGNAVETMFEISDPAGNPGESLTWRSHPSGLRGWNFQPVAGAFAGGTFVVVGETWVGQPIVVRSFNGHQWVGTIPPEGTPTSDGWGMLKAVAGANGIWLAGGVNSNLWRSTDDGATWNKLPPLVETFFDLTGLAMQGTTVVAVGKLARESGGEGAGIFVSEDAGLTWEALDVVDFPALRGVAYGHGVWLAVGERGVILRSELPEEEWELVPSGTLQTLRVAHVSHFAALAWGEAGVMLRSTDEGETWEAVAAGSGYWPGTIASDAGFLVLSGGEKAAGSSSRDGMSWTLPREAGAYGVVMAGAGGFFALNGDNVWFTQGPWPPGVFSPEWPPGFSVGETIALPLSATGDPTSWRITGLPRGVTVDRETGEISGVIRQAGNRRLTILASNGAGSSPPRIVHLNITNPFPPVAGTYVVPIPFDLSSAAEPLRRGGWLQLQVNSLGLFTGRLTLAGGEISLRGEFDHLGQATIALPPEIYADTLLVLNLSINDPEAGTIGARFLEMFASFSFPGQKNPWHARHQPAALWEGVFTTGLAPEGEPIENVAGFASHRVNRNGTFRLAGRTPDGANFTAGGFVLADGAVPFFMVRGRERALITGALRPDSTSLDQEFSDSVLWVPESAGSVNETLRARGARYARPLAGQMLWGLPEANNNAELQVGANKVDVTILTNHRIVLPGEAPARSASLQLPRGTWSGHTSPESGPSAAFHGIILTAPWNKAVGLTAGQNQAAAVVLQPARP